MKKFTALHLADLRLRRVDAQPEAICALFDDIAAYRDAGHVIDAIFFSGDLVAPDACAGTTPAYVYEQFLRPVLQAASAPGTRFYLVPDQRAAGRARNSHFDGSGFSFFSAPLDAAGERRALYKNLHGVFHGHSEATSGASLMNALGVLYKSHPGSLYRQDDRDDNDGSGSATLSYALLEYEARPERSWTVALRQYDDASGRFAVANLYLPDGKANLRIDAQYVFATLLPRADAADGYIDGLLGMANLPASALFDAASIARAFLIELAFYMYEAGKTALEIDEMAHFATDHCAVANLGVAPASLVDSLCSNGLLLDADGLMMFQFDYFRTFFLAQRFETSIDLRHYSMPRPATATVATVASAASLASMPYLSRLAASGGILAEDNLLTLFSKQP